MRATGNKSLHAYRLSIRNTADGFSVFIYQGESSKPCEQQQVKTMPGEQPHEALDKMLSRHRLVSLSFNTVEIVADVPTTRVPLEEFRRSEVEMLYKLVFPDISLTQNKVCYEVLPYLEVVEIFAVDCKWIDTVAAHFPDVQLRSMQGNILEAEARAQMRQTPSGKQLHVCRLAKDLFVYSIHRKHLTFACTYQAEAPADVLFYVLYAWKIMKFDVEQDVCVVHDRNKTLATDLKRYLAQVELCE